MTKRYTAEIEHGIGNLARLYGMATPTEYAAGLNWFPEAHAGARALARTHDLPIRTTAAVISAISLRRTWERNVRDADTLIRNWRVAPHDPHRAGIPLPSGRAPIRMAYHVLNGGDLRGPKCIDFATCVADPMDPTTVCVDSHIADGWIGVLTGEPTNITPARYARIAAGIRGLASDVGLLPQEYEAIIWIVVRNIKARATAAERAAAAFERRARRPIRIVL